MKRHATGFAFIATMLAASAHGEEQCRLQQYAKMPVTMSGTRPVVGGTINGKPAQFLADSGAFYSMLSRDSAAQYGLTIGLMPLNFRIRGTGGTERVGKTQVEAFTLTGFYGGQVVRNVDFIVGGNGTAGGITGILGQNILGQADTEYDLANGFIRMFRAEDCKGPQVAYWSGSDAVAEVKISDTSPGRPHLVGNAKLNGKKIIVIFDTGAFRSILDLQAAQRIGITPEDDGVMAGGISQGIGKRSTENSIARFDTFDVGGEVIRNARLRIGEVQLAYNADMLLGADFFLSHRVYIATQQRRIYFTYNGGQVFDLRPGNADKPAPGTSAEPLTASAPTPATDQVDSAQPSITAAELRRRGAASAGRLDFAAAIADLDRAVALDPTDVEALFERGRVHMQSRKPQLAMADFNAALKLQPGHIESLLWRGAMNLGRRDIDGAQADFDAARRLAPQDASVELRIAESWLASGNFKLAVERLDAWIAARPKDDRLPAALHMRCRARGMSGENLELAVADCSDSIKKGSRNSAVLDSRALAWLRMSRFDNAIDDYQAALKLQPKSASALYGLGIAETRKGLHDQGAADIRSAIALNPNIAAVYERSGVKP